MTQIPEVPEKSARCRGKPAAATASPQLESADVPS